MEIQTERQKYLPTTTINNSKLSIDIFWLGFLFTNLAFSSCTYTHSSICCMPQRIIVATFRWNIALCGQNRECIKYLSKHKRQGLPPGIQTETQYILISFSQNLLWLSFGAWLGGLHAACTNIKILITHISWLENSIQIRYKYVLHGIFNM